MTLHRFFVSLETNSAARTFFFCFDLFSIQCRVDFEVIQHFHNVIFLIELILRMVCWSSLFCRGNLSKVTWIALSFPFGTLLGLNMHLVARVASHQLIEGLVMSMLTVSHAVAFAISDEPNAVESCFKPNWMSEVAFLVFATKSAFAKLICCVKWNRGLIISFLGIRSWVSWFSLKLVHRRDVLLLCLILGCWIRLLMNTFHWIVAWNFWSYLLELWRITLIKRTDVIFGQVVIIKAVVSLWTISLVVHKGTNLGEFVYPFRMTFMAAFAF